MDSIVLNGHHLHGDKAYVSPSTEEDDELLYQYDDEEDDESQNQVIGGHVSPIFSRLNSPPPRHRNNVKEVDRLYLNEEPKKDVFAYDYDDEENENIQRDYYNARYPPRRGRYGRNMDVGNTAFYRPRYVNGNSAALIKKKMEWKRKEVVTSESCVTPQGMENEKE